MKPKLQFLIVVFIVLTIYIPVVHGQANLTFSGGNGTPLTITLQNSVTYTTNSNCINGPFFVFDEAGNPFLSTGSNIVGGTSSFSVNGGTAVPIERAGSGVVAASLTLNDIFIYGNQPGAPSGSTVVLQAGTITTADNFAGAPPANGSFATFLTSSNFARCSTDGVALPAAGGAANLTFSGGNGTPLTITLQNSVTYTTNSDCVNGPFFVFDEAGNPFSSSIGIVAGTISFSVNGGTAVPIERAGSGVNGTTVTVNDIFIFGNQSGASNGSTVVLSAGTITTADNFAGAPPANGSFATFLTGSTYVRCSTNGVAPTAASVSVGGRVMTESGRGIRSVKITLTDSSGNVRTATTTAFGYYRFADVSAGETYIITAFGKSYTFSQPSQVLNINGDLTDIDFIGYSKFFYKQ